MLDDAISASSLGSLKLRTVVTVDELDANEEEEEEYDDEGEVEAEAEADDEKLEGEEENEEEGVEILRLEEPSVGMGVDRGEDLGARCCLLFISSS